MHFRELDYKLVMSILDPKLNFSEGKPSVSEHDKVLLKFVISSFDLKRLEAYASHRKDYGEVITLVPGLAKCYF